jgi:hypothetical protein
MGEERDAILKFMDELMRMFRAEDILPAKVTGTDNGTGTVT